MKTTSTLSPESPRIPKAPPFPTAEGWGTRAAVPRSCTVDLNSCGQKIEQVVELMQRKDAQSLDETTQLLGSNYQSVLVPRPTRIDLIAHKLDLVRSLPNLAEIIYRVHRNCAGACARWCDSSVAALVFQNQA